MTPPEARHDLYARLGYRRHGLGWPKVEILLGLTGAGLGMLLGGRLVVAGDWSLAAAALALFVLGGYLALAGHRSHLYQASNELAAFLADEIRQSKGKGPPA
jgi:hypothetical protein